MTARILVLSGSARRESFNAKLAAIGAAAARAAGAEVTSIDPREFAMPLYDGDLEAAEGLPEAVVRMKAEFLRHDGLFFACPEYNSSITPLLKNTIDWVSRPAPGEGSLACYRGKVAALLAASPGALGGLRGLVTVRSILSNIGVIVLPTQIAIPRAAQAFGPDGNLADAAQQKSVESLAAELVRVVGRLSG